MDKTKQRIAIATACNYQEPFETVMLWEEPANDMARRVPVLLDGENRTVPDYLGDLNAMHEAEKVANFTARQHGEYVEHLISAVTRDHADDGWMCRCNADMCIYATAAQRAEAFLKAIGKWEDA